MDLIPGAVQAIVHTIIGHPFDTIKTRMQTGIYKNSFQCFSIAMKTEGLSAIYRGVTMPVLSHLVKRPIQFPIFHYLKDKDINRYLSGSISGAFGTFWGGPLQVVKINMQASQSKENKNTKHFISKHYKKYGIGGFYRGFKINLLKDSIFGASFLGNYTLISENLPSQITTGRAFISGAISNILTWWLFIPIDSIKTVVQREGITNKEALLKIIEKNGYFGFWKGIAPATLKQALAPGLAMTAYELCRELIRDD